VTSILLPAVTRAVRRRVWLPARRREHRHL